MTELPFPLAIAKFMLVDLPVRLKDEYEHRFSPKPWRCKRCQKSQNIQNWYHPLCTNCGSPQLVLRSSYRKDARSL